MLEELHSFIRQTLRKKRSGFIDSDEILSAINRSSEDLWKELVDIFRNSGSASELLYPFKDSSVETATAGVLTVTDKGKAAVTGCSIISSGVEYPSRLILTDSDWAVRKAIPIDMSDTSLLKMSEDLTVAGDSSEFPLPVDYVSHKNVVYTKDGAELSEGQILPENEVVNRLTSRILAPEDAHPVATIVDNKIQIYPISNGNVYMFPYMTYSSERMGMSRPYTAGSDMKVELDPASSTDAKVYFYNFPVQAEADVVYLKGEGTLTVTTDLDWNDNAFGEIASRALFYLGFPINDTQAMSLEQAKNSSEIQTPNK